MTKKRQPPPRPSHASWMVKEAHSDDLDEELEDDFDLIEVDLEPCERPMGLTCDAPLRRNKRSPFYWRVNIRKKYDPHLHWDDFESVKTCHRKKAKRINQLRRLPTHNAGARSLLEVLEACRANRRCGSMACPICMRRFRRWQVSEALFTLRHEERSTYRFVTLVLHQYVMEYGFDPGKIRSFKRGLMKRLQAQLPDGARLIGWIEVAWEPDVNAFMPHFHGIAAGATYEGLRALKPKNNLVKGKRPLVIKRIKDGTEMRLATYCVKQFPRRWTDRQKKGAKRNGTSSGPSAVRASIELQRLIGLAKFRPEELLVMRGVRRNKNGRRLRRI